MGGFALENQLYNLIEQLEELLDRGTKVPLTGKVMIDENFVLEILENIRAVLPEEIREANSLLADRNRIIGNARKEGQNIIEQSEKQAERMISENRIVKESQIYADEITKESQDYAEELVHKAQQYSKEVKLGALKYSDDLLYDLESKLGQTIKSLKESREELTAMARWDERIKKIDEG